MKRFSLVLTLALLLAAPFVSGQVPGKIPDRYGYTYSDNAYVRWGNAEDAVCGYNTTQTPDALYCGVSTDSNTMILGEKADASYDFAHALATDPTLFIQSHNQSATQWISFSHDGTNGVIDVGTGVVSFPDGVGLSTVAPATAGPLTVGSSGTTAVTVTTDDTGDAEEVHRANSIGPGEVFGLYKELILCGELAENGTTFLGPSTGQFGGNGADLSIGGTACDALDNVTEATADAPISPLATKINGMYCTTDGTLGASESIVYTLRTAAANAVTTDGAATTVTCTIGTGETACRSPSGTTTNIAAGATVAISATETSNNADDNGWCSVMVSFP